MKNLLLIVIVIAGLASCRNTNHKANDYKGQTVKMMHGAYECDINGERVSEKVYNEVMSKAIDKQAEDFRAVPVTYIVTIK